MSALNRQVLLASRPTGWVTPDNFRFVDVPVPVPAEGQVLVRNRFLSLDPYMRGRMDAAKSYAASVEIGSIMVGGTVGHGRGLLHSRAESDDATQYSENKKRQFRLAGKHPFASGALRASSPG